jgi:predicted lipid-binding transport protein (Tim44 family)
MKRFALFLTIVLTSLSLLAANAEAKRFGGGSSFGKQRTMSAPAQKSADAAPAQATSAQTAAPAKPANKWLGPLAGIAAGLGLAALFSHFGLGEGMGMLLMIILGAVAVFFVISMLRKKQQPAMQYAGAGAPYGGSQQPVAQPLTGGASGAAPVAAANVPADFPVESFLRGAKTTFIRLQAANDRKDLDDIREYTTPEMFAEVSMQMQERGDAAQKTDVVSISTDLLEVATEGDLAIASVRMSGQLRENNGAAESFDEIWHVQKNLKDDKSVWLLAGIQQN